MPSNSPAPSRPDRQPWPTAPPGRLRQRSAWCLVEDSEDARVVRVLGQLRRGCGELVGEIPGHGHAGHHLSSASRFVHLVSAPVSSPPAPAGPPEPSPSRFGDLVRTLDVPHGSFCISLHLVIGSSSSSRAAALSAVFGRHRRRPPVGGFVVLLSVLDDVPPAGLPRRRIHGTTSERRKRRRRRCAHRCAGKDHPLRPCPVDGARGRGRVTAPRGRGHCRPPQGVKAGQVP